MNFVERVKSWRIISFIFLVILVVVATLFVSKPTLAVTYVNNDISIDTRWTIDQSPYIILGQRIVKSDVTLTIEPGVVVKLYYGVSLVVKGVLRAIGTSSQKIYFTSIADDGVGGDTEGDGDESHPEPRDWLHIKFDTNSVGTFDYAVVRYAGALPMPWTGIHSNGGTITLSHSEIYLNGDDGIVQNGGSFFISNSKIHDNLIGINNSIGQMTIINSSIYNNSYYGLQNNISVITTAQNNWWGDATGPYHLVLNPGGLGNQVSDNVDFIPWLTSDPTQEQKNQIPQISILGQFESNGVTPILEGTIIAEDSVIFKTVVTDPDDGKVKLQIEVKKFDQPFNGTDFLETNFVNSGEEASITKENLNDGEYHWRARAVDNQDNVSAWQELGETGNIDFEIKLPLAFKAAILAKKLVNNPEAYLWGGKGWDYDQNEFVPSANILAGYKYLQRHIGIGVDCSGLITWAFNRSFNSLLSSTKNFVKYVNADGLYRDYQSDQIEETDLLPGDVMFFDWDNNENIDHVAMYVGQSGGYDVVNAKSPDFGIVKENKDNYKRIRGFKGFRRIHEGTIAMKITTGSPINLSVTDPDGFTINSNTVVQSNEEYIREIRGTLYYLELEKGHDGNPIDQVYSPVLKNGDYLIKVLPVAGVLSYETYILTFQAGEQTFVLAKNIPLSQIPNEGYGIHISENGRMNTYIPVSIDIKPGNYLNQINLKSKGNIPIAILGSSHINVEQINPSTIKIAGAGLKMKGNGHLLISYSDVNDDGFNDMVVHVITEELQLVKSDDTKIELSARLINGDTIKGIDSVQIMQDRK